MTLKPRFAKRVASAVVACSLCGRRGLHARLGRAGRADVRAADPLDLVAIIFNLSLRLGVHARAAQDGLPDVRAEVPLRGWRPSIVAGQGALFGPTFSTQEPQQFASGPRASSSVSVMPGKAASVPMYLVTLAPSPMSAQVKVMLRMMLSPFHSTVASMSFSLIEVSRFRVPSRSGAGTAPPLSFAVDVALALTRAEAGHLLRPSAVYGMIPFSMNSLTTSPMREISMSSSSLGPVPRAIAIGARD